jgi:5,10-methylenetetrahydromethanopterin reductase
MRSHQTIGFATGYDPTLNVRDIATLIRHAELSGFDVGFFSETDRVMRDGPSVMSATALSTSAIGLGFVQVVHLRSPLVMAQTIATLDELSGGRLFLAPGAITPHVAARHSLPPIDVAQGLVEYVEAIRLLLTGDEVIYHGRFVNLDHVRLGWTPIRASIPMYFASATPKGLRLAAELGDGVVLDACTSPEYSAKAIAIIRDALEARGRSWSEFRVAQIVSCSVEDDHAAALDAIRWEVAAKFEPRQHAFQRRRAEVGEPHVRATDLPRFEEAWRRGGWEALVAAIPNDYCEGLTASGTPDEVRRRVQQYREAGVDLPLVRSAASHQAERLLKVFGRAGPMGDAALATTAGGLSRD